MAQSRIQNIVSEAAAGWEERSGIEQLYSSCTFASLEPEIVSLLVTLPVC